MPERAIEFSCKGDHLTGVLHLPAQETDRGVLLVVGGPQYRVGSHRQFVLLARSLAESGIAAMRFDYRGMGDSTGDQRSFESVNDDIHEAVDHFLSEVAGIRTLVLWGLCDAATASLAYAARDPRVGGVVMLNPWVRTEAGIAGAYLRRYYFRRLLDRKFWQKIGRGEFDATASLRSAARMIRAAAGWKAERAASENTETLDSDSDPDSDSLPNEPLPIRMLSNLNEFGGRVLVILSGDDLTADEFRHATAKSRRLRRALAHPRITRKELPSADHTFSRGSWRKQVEEYTVEWLRSFKV